VTIRDFLVAILGQMEGRVSLWWRKDYGPKAEVKYSKWYQYPEELDRMVSDAESRVDKDVYVTVATYSEDERQPHKTLQANCVWLDADTCDPAHFRVEPSIVVESSPGRWQAYWALSEPVRAAEASVISRKIAYAHRDTGADLSSWPSNKIMRLPGTSNTNWGFPSRVSVVKSTGTVYTIDDLAAAYEDVNPESPAYRPVEVPEYEAADFFEAQAKLPADFPLELLTAEPDVGPDGNRSEMRWRLIAELVEAGLNDSEVLAVAWQAPASSKWHEDPRGERGIREEIAKERLRFEAGMGFSIPPEGIEQVEVKVDKPQSIKRSLRPEPVKILSSTDRARAQKLWPRTWIGEYEEWMRNSVRVFNGAYHRAAAWSAISALLGDLAFVHDGQRYLPLNIWTWTLGPTTTGKSEARDGMQLVVHRAFSTSKNPDVGDDSSTTGLLEKLHKMSDQAVLFNSDEADGLIEEMVAQGNWRTGQMSKWTFLYDGKVPPQTRAGNTDGEWSKCCFNMYMAGTEEGVFGVLSRKMFAKGFLTRMCWFVGEQVEVPEELLGFSDSPVEAADTDKVSDWKQRFAQIRQTWGFRSMGKGGHLEVITTSDDEAREFFRSTTAKIQTGPLSKHPNWDIIKPSIIRLSTTMYKMAALLAISSGRTTITRDDMLVALYQGEELLGNLVWVANNISDSEHSKSLDKLETYLAGYPTGAASPEIYRAMAGKGYNKRDVDSMVAELVAQRRVRYKRRGEGVWEATVL
jgi:hypothetical protein